MGKYYSFKHEYDNNPLSKSNFINALKHIGKKDPNNIIITRLGGQKPKLGKKLSEKQYINRGILNVRKELNRHLGKSGKVTNRMIRLCSEVKIVRTENNIVWLKSKLPYRDYNRIVTTTYDLLRKCDSICCSQLFNREKGDKYIQKEINKSKKHKTVAPIQTNMIIRTFAGKSEEISVFANNFRKNILEGK